MSTPTRPVLVAATAVALTAPLFLSGCSIGDTVSKQAQNAACSLVTPITDKVAADIDAALKSAVLDPAAAIDQLKAARTILGPIADQIPVGEQKTAVQNVVDTIDQLIPVLKAESIGSTTGTSSDVLTKKLSEQMKALTTLC
ncbi:MAG: hypothetical protein J0I18_16335 [Actinobacteria bacterium]|jgi:hypothetical protein|uniref:Lipoprotein n=1 Tax=Leifsonia shinshuensis TaxID=150026 RepID=A0A7G6YBR0_9MICO|nr:MULTISPECIES: hypothetical protein [Leifsonia]MBN9632157.1 hypothetical protein [Actinomycetota bacterium]NUU08632.1 hypothetical protein [Leifsonia sp. C5G2]QNE35925.1 hypothetical protein F1C12_12840 [Leifsonia shinshuensis]